MTLCAQHQPAEYLARAELGLPTEMASTPGLIKPWRVFLALPLPEAARSELVQVQRYLQGRRGGEGTRWVSPDQMHLTLLFFGHVMPEQVTGLETTLRPLCAGRSRFRLRLDKAGCFPDVRRPRVIWVGLSGDTERLCQFQQRLQEAAVGFGDHEETRTFQPHLTIGRVKMTQALDLKQLGQRLQTCPPPATVEWTVDHAELMRSQLSSQGATYEVLARLPLGDPGHRSSTLQ